MEIMTLEEFIIHTAFRVASYAELNQDAEWSSTAEMIKQANSAEYYDLQARATLNTLDGYHSYVTYMQQYA